VPAGRTHLVKAKRAIDYRLDLVGGDGGILHYVHHVLPDSGIAMTLPLRMVRAVGVEAGVIGVQVWMTGSVSGRSPKQGRPKPVFCCRRLLSSSLLFK
jgi:hypothetical protein